MTGRHFQERASGPALVVGGDGLVGGAIRRHCRELGIEVESSSRRPGSKALSLDLCNPDFTPLERAN
jgi:nucleoside-diphosphate-sugar epimerase